MRKLLVAMLGSILLCGALTMVTASSASAYSSPDTHGQYWWEHNGCTLVPDAPSASGVSFTYACNHHDGCYHLHWGGEGIWGKITCDQWFWNDMYSACQAARAGWYRANCLAWAGAYWTGVRVLGDIFYYARWDPTIRL
jgi:hypothetical protein